MPETEEPKPREWTCEDANRSGKMAYRIGVLLSGNPFKNVLADEWIRGWNLAQANDPYIRQKKVNYVEERPDDERPRRDYNRDSSSRPRSSYSSSGGRRR